MTRNLSCGLALVATVFGVACQNAIDSVFGDLQPNDSLDTPYVLMTAASGQTTGAGTPVVVNVESHGGSRMAVQGFQTTFTYLGADAATTAACLDLSSASDPALMQLITYPQNGQGIVAAALMGSAPEGGSCVQLTDAATMCPSLVCPGTDWLKENWISVISPAPVPPDAVAPASLPDAAAGLDSPDSPSEDAAGNNDAKTEVE